MAITVELSCPLGHTCEKVVDNKIVRCMWYTCLAGADPQTGKPLEDEWRCAMSWMPIMLVENAMTNRGQTAALESFRNETVKSSELTNEILIAAANQQRQLLLSKE